MSITYLRHDLHGVHVAYSEDEVKRLEKDGWKRRDAVQAQPAPALQPVQDAPTTLHLPKRRGRPPAGRGA